MSEQIENDEFDGPPGMEHVIAVLTAGHLDSQGGYPYDWQEHQGKVFIAALDPGKECNATVLKVFSVRRLQKWEHRAIAYHEENADSTWEEAVYETSDP